MAAPALSPPPLTPEEYLEIERRAEIRSEYLDGEMFAMAGASFEHNAIVANLIGELRQKLKGKSCQVLPSDLRIHVPATGLYTYSDVLVVCGEPRLEDHHHDTLLNPTLIIEVLSPSSEAYDRGKKFEHYRSIESFVEYLLVTQDEPRVEQYLRQPAGRWLFTAVAGLDATIALPSIQCELSLAEVYDRVELG
ncbi:MAG TPA: Uma2 family endonuclease [Thermoanaerobaculia bacterium]|jgi:Uma2 family endonuclease|nr:Uma2 family endonuclease [Thermoanaerobaculia bacterium]